MTKARYSLNLVNRMLPFIVRLICIIPLGIGKTFLRKNRLILNKQTHKLWRFRCPSFQSSLHRRNDPFLGKCPSIGSKLLLRWVYFFFINFRKIRKNCNVLIWPCQA